MHRIHWPKFKILSVVSSMDSAEKAVAKVLIEGNPVLFLGLCNVPALALLWLLHMAIVVIKSWKSLPQGCPGCPVPSLVMGNFHTHSVEKPPAICMSFLLPDRGH